MANALGAMLAGGDHEGDWGEDGRNDMTTYTILTSQGEVIKTGLSLNDAAAEVLTSDGCEFDIRADLDGGFTLWTRQQVANRPWTATSFVSFAAYRADAEREIFRDVVTTDLMQGHNEAIPDELYRQMLDEAEERE